MSKKSTFRGRHGRMRLSRRRIADATVHHRTGTANVVRALLRKELLVELRTLESIPGMSLFAVTTFVVFHFALNQNTVSGQEAAGILWVTLLFAAMLGVNRLFVADADQGGFDGFLLAPVDRSALLIAKAIALLAYLLVLELVAVPAFGLLLLGPPLGQALPGLLAPLALGDLGVAAIGTLVAAMAVRTRARDLLGPLLALPLLVPVVIGVRPRHRAAVGAQHPAARRCAGLGRSRSMILFSASSPTPCSTSSWRTRRTACTSPRTSRPLASPPSSAFCVSLSLVFFYAPIEAEEGFLQKIFYLHVPLAIVTPVRVRDRRPDGDRPSAHARPALGPALLCDDPHEPDLRRGGADHRLDLGARARGDTGGCGTSPRSCRS